MKQIYDYDDYQKYLFDYYEEKKQNTTYFSFRYMADRTGIDAGFLSKVCNGKMHLSVKSIDQLCLFLKFNEKETEYFRLLVRFGRATVPAEIKAYYEEILQVRGIDLKRISDQYYEFYHKWYYTAIRAILSFYRFKDDYKSLAEKVSPPISVEQARKAITLLSRMGFIEQESDGYYTLTSRHISTGEKWQTAAIHGFQEETIDLAKQSLSYHSKSLRDISSVTLSVHHKDFEEIRERAKEFRRSLMQMETGNGPSDMVYQVNLQIIPMSSQEDEA